MKQRLQDQVRFLVEIDKLKHVVRRTKLYDGSRYENDVEHSWHLSLLAMVLSEYSNEPVDAMKIVKMVLIHDIVEIDAGDFFFYDAGLAQSKEVEEKKAAARIFGLLPEDQRQEFEGLWEEFEKKETAEARFAAALDRFEPITQNLHNAGETWKKHGITKDEVVRRNKPIVTNGSRELWEFIEALIDEGSRKGYFPEK
jgi:putative hydrolases of HD superfamily